MAAASVQPEAISVSTRLCTWLPATDLPQCATISISKKPGGGSFQSLNVRTAMLFRNASIDCCSSPSLFASLSNRLQEPIHRGGAHREQACGAPPRPAANARVVPSQSTSVGIASFSRFPQIRSAASQRIVSAAHRLLRRRSATAALAPIASTLACPFRAPGSRACGESPLPSTNSSRIFFFSDRVAGLIPLRDRLDQFSSGCQTQLPPDSVARHVAI